LHSVLIPCYHNTVFWPLSSPSASPPSQLSPSFLHSITLYPVKSCAGFKVHSWPVGEKGLVLDREWMVRSEHGSLLSQKQEPKLCLVHPSIEPKTCSLTLTAEGTQQGKWA
jgi:molybdenum cofactor sulfurtransferase